MQCEICGDHEATLQDYYGNTLCNDCIAIEQEAAPYKPDQQPREIVAQTNDH